MRRAVWLGVLVAGVAAAFVVLWRARPTLSAAEAPPTVPAAAAPAELDGFRADAWYLPDDPALGFVDVPAGTFVMGSDPAADPAAYDNEWWSPGQAQDTVGVPAFYVARYEVTVAQLGAFVAASGYRIDPLALAGPPDHPAASVSWPDALAYARWLDATLRGWADSPPAIATRLREGWHVQLPSEPQWEKAARGTDGRVYPWGADPRLDRANYEGEATRPVGSYGCPECPHGLSDMSGNVWEWTRSPFQPYPFDPSNDATGLDQNALWVIRGGSFADPARNVRAAVRGGGDPGVRRRFIGFRVVISGE